MRTFPEFCWAISISTIIAFWGIDSADAGKNWPITDQCHSRMEGVATSKGILGLGTANARLAARHNWENLVTKRYGTAYSNLDRASDIRWDCKKGAILLAKCVVTAKPCGPSARY
jgi:hypothetical protein